MGSDDNPNVQCEKCGRWYRLFRTDGTQWIYAFYPEEHGWPDIEWENICVSCHLDFGIVLSPYEEANTGKDNLSTPNR